MVNLLNWAAFALLTLIWGSTFLAIRVSNATGYDPFSAAAVRVVLAALFLLPLARALRLEFPRGRLLAVVLGAGALMFGINFGLLYWGEVTVNSGTAAVLWGVYPVWMALGAALTLEGEPLTLRGLAGAVLAAVGLVVVFWSQLRLDAPLAGFAAVLGGILCATIASLLVKKWGHDVHPLVYNALGAAAGAPVLVGLAFVAGDGLALPPDDAAWGAFLFLLVAGSLVAFNVWAWLLQRWPATRLSFQTVLSPLIAVALGAALLGEVAEPTFLAGTALVLFGTFLALRPTRPVAGAGDAAQAPD